MGEKIATMRKILKTKKDARQSNVKRTVRRILNVNGTNLKKFARKVLQINVKKLKRKTARKVLPVGGIKMKIVVLKRDKRIGSYYVVRKGLHIISSSDYDYF